MASFEMAYAPVARWVLSLSGHGPRNSGVTVDDGEVRVWMGWAFRVTARRSQVRQALRTSNVWWGVGVHVYPNAHWIVNGSLGNIVTIRLEPEAKGRLYGLPIRVRSLSISVREPDHLVAELR